MHCSHPRPARAAGAVPRGLALPLVALLLLALVGCRLIRSSSHTRYEGTRVSQQTLEQIEPGDSQALVLALLGEPGSRTELADDRELWKWSYRQTRTNEGGVLLLLASRTTTEEGGTVFVVFEDDRVQRVWRD